MSIPIPCSWRLCEKRAAGQTGIGPSRDQVLLRAFCEIHLEVATAAACQLVHEEQLRAAGHEHSFAPMPGNPVDTLSGFLACSCSQHTLTFRFVHTSGRSFDVTASWQRDADAAEHQLAAARVGGLWGGSVDYELRREREVS